MRRFVSTWFDLRKGELRPVAQAFLVLFAIIAAHTMLETARDALFLTKLPPRQLNLVYVALAALSLPVSAAATRLTTAFGRRNALVVSLCVAALVTAGLYVMPPTARAIMALYIASGLIGATLTPQFWLLAADLFTSAQGRRLFGPIASGGVVGGATGAGAALLLLTRIPVTALVLVSSFAFLATALIVTTFETGAEESPFSKAVAPKPKAKPSLSLSEQPFVWRVALLVGLSTAAVLSVDFMFKSTAARAVPPAELGAFFARYYAVMNVASLVVQLFIAGRVVRHLGVAPATAVMPSLLLLGGVASLLSGGALVPALATRLIDGGMRHSLNRVATELLYLPMPPAVRERAKGLIDTVLARAVQAATALLLFGLGVLGVLAPRVLAALVVGLCLLWTLVALTMRARYLDLFRRTLARGALSFEPGTFEIDVNAVEALVEAMASPDPSQVVAAMDILEQRQRSKLIPALVLYHDAEPVLFRALEIFGASSRADWIPLGERLLSHDSEAVRVAAVRALAKRGVWSGLAKAISDTSSSVQAYAAFFMALASEREDLASDPGLAKILSATDASGETGRDVLLRAIADTKDPRGAALVLAIVERTEKLSLDAVTHVATAMQALNDARFLPFLIARLAFREGRDAIRQALVAMGEPALAALEAALVDPETERNVRVHVPRTIARFGTQRACDFLLERLAHETDGFVRYKVLRGIGLMVADSDVVVDRPKVEREARRNLVEHLRAMAYRVGLDRGRSGERAPSEHLLVGLLRDKERQALERAFRLLKIAHKHEDIHRVHAAATSSDKKIRSNAGEFIDSLLSARGQSDVRELFRLAIDDLEPADRVSRALAHLGDVPRTRDDALATLIEDRDEALATLASYHALTLGSEQLRAKVERARDGRQSIDALLQRFLATTTLSGRPA